MRQKFMIFQDTDKNTLTIREYAVVNKKPKRWFRRCCARKIFHLWSKKPMTVQASRNLSPRGVEALVTPLRTTNLFPIKPYATKIAESVIAMYDSSEDNSAELFFDDQGP